MKYLTVTQLTVLAVIAAVNSVMEISIGSLMHMFKIPAVGTFMIMVNLSLYLIARNIVPKKGVIMIVGFITAFIKLVYGGELSRLGPSAAIFLEAALIEAVFLFLPLKNWSAMVSGGFANVFVLFYPFISYLLFGGRGGAANIEKVMSSASKILPQGLPEAFSGGSFGLLVFVVVLIYFFMGFFIGMASWMISLKGINIYESVRRTKSINV